MSSAILIIAFSLLFYWDWIKDILTKNVFSTMAVMLESSPNPVALAVSWKRNAGALKNSVVFSSKKCLWWEYGCYNKLFYILFGLWNYNCSLVRLNCGCHQRANGTLSHPEQPEPSPRQRNWLIRSRRQRRGLLERRRLRQLTNMNILLLLMFVESYVFVSLRTSE